MQNSLVKYTKSSLPMPPCHGRIPVLSFLPASDIAPWADKRLINALTALAHLPNFLNIWADSHIVFQLHLRFHYRLCQEDCRNDKLAVTSPPRILVHAFPPVCTPRSNFSPISLLSPSSLAPTCLFSPIASSFATSLTCSTSAFLEADQKHPYESSYSLDIFQSPLAGYPTLSDHCSFASPMSTFVAASRSLSLIPRPLFSNSAPSSDLSVPLPTRVLSVDDLQPIKILGVGSFGTVYLTKDRTTSINLAVKVIPKDDISGQYLDEVIDVLVMEQKVMLALRDSKRALALYASWHDTRYFYLASEYCPNGDLRSEIDRWGVLPPAYARYLAAELLLALEELHSRGMIHRDIKPDNILFDSAGHLRLADFGMARVFSADELAGQAEVKHFPSAYADEDAEVPFGYTNRACGTLDFCAPEILTDSPYTYAPDFWAMGVVVFVMLTGRPPFTALSEEQIISRVLFEPLKFKKSDGIDAAATDFLRKVLRKNPSTRLTVSEMKAHPFFAEIDWIALAEGKVAPPSVPPAHVLRSTGHGLYLPRGAPYTTKEDPYPSYTYTAPILVPSPALTTVSVLRPRKLDVVRHFFSQYLRAHRAATASVRLQDPAEVQVEIEVRVEVREEAHNDGRRGAGPDRENWHDPLPELLLAAPLPPAVPPMWDFSDAPAPDAPKLVPAVLLPRESRSWVDEPALGSETPAAGNGKVKAWLRGMFAKAVAGG